MSWVSDEQSIELLKFLEISPPLNRRGNLKIEEFSFSTTEFRTLGQTLDILQKVDLANGWRDVQLSDDEEKNEHNKKRYSNTLIRMGLFIGESDNLVLSDTSLDILRYANDNHLFNLDLNSDENISHAVHIERIILDNLLSVIQDESQSESRVYGFAVDIFYRLQEFFESIKEVNFENFIEDLDLIYFCQAINASFFEVKRFFKLSQQEQDVLKELWYSLANDRVNFPNTVPHSALKKVPFYYTRAKNKKSLQMDVRFRCRNLLLAYKAIIESKIVPQISKDHVVMRTKEHELKSFNTLPELEERKELPIEHQLIVSGCPGSGKSRFLSDLLEEDKNIQIKRVTAHPDYSYSDLIGCYKPVPVYQKGDSVYRESGEEFKKGIPKINYEFVQGPLIEQYISARLNPTYNFVVLIEEINRTNCNALFGDFFQLLDRKSGVSEYPIYAMPDLAPLLESNGLPKEIVLPENLYICGTMNAADQGVFQLDSAFRRRWEFQYKGYSEPCMYKDDEKKLIYGGNTVDWDEFRQAINVVLKELSIHEDKLIGPYFLKVNELNNSEKICNKLFLYLWDDVLRFQRNELMDFGSFSELKVAWNNGAGAPLRIDI